MDTLTRGDRERALHGFLLVLFLRRAAGVGIAYVAEPGNWVLPPSDVIPCAHPRQRREDEG